MEWFLKKVTSAAEKRSDDAGYSTIPTAAPLPTTTSTTTRFTPATSLSLRLESIEDTLEELPLGPRSESYPPPITSSSRPMNFNFNPTSYALQRGMFAVVPPPKPEVKTLTIKGPNIMVIGPQHSGKSSFINTYRRAVTGHDGWAQAPVGRSVQRGTTSLEPYMPSTRDDEVQFLMLDTAGRRLRPLDVNDETSEDAVVYSQVLRGTAWKASMVEGGGSGMEENAANAVDHVVIVISAEDVCVDRGVMYTLWLGSGGRYVTTLENVDYLASVFSWLERRMAMMPPYIVVTHMDRVGRNADASIRKELGSLVHKNRIFFVANPEDLASITPGTTKVVRKLHECITADIKARDATAPRSMKKSA